MRIGNLTKAPGKAIQKLIELMINVNNAWQDIITAANC